MGDERENIADIHGINPPFQEYSDFTPQTVKSRLARVNLDALIEKGAMLVEIWPDDVFTPIILIAREQRVFAYLNRCPHANWPLDSIDGNFIFDLNDDLVCAGHGAIFDVTNGHCLGGPGRGSPLRAFPFKIEGEEIILGDE